MPLTPEQEALRQAAQVAIEDWRGKSLPERMRVAAQFHAAANPATILALLDQLEVVQAATDKLLTIIAYAYQVAGAHDAPEHILDVLADPEAATVEQVDAMLPYQPEIVQPVQAVPDRWHDLVEWLLGKNGQFPARKSPNEGLYWWRKELRARYEKLAGVVPGELGQ